MPIREVERRAATVVGVMGPGPTSTAYGCGASVVWAVAVAVGDAKSDVEAVARIRPEFEVTLAGDRLTTVAAMASKRKAQTDVRIRRPRLIRSYSPADKRKSIRAGEEPGCGSPRLSFWRAWRLAFWRRGQASLTPWPPALGGGGAGAAL